MGLTDKIAPAAGNLKDTVQAGAGNIKDTVQARAGNVRDTVQAAMQPYAGSVSDDGMPTVEEVKEAASNGASWLTGPALNGASVQLQCREACLPLCSSISSMNTNNTLPCWNDSIAPNVIFGKNVGTLGSASVLALLLVLASLVGFIGGQRIDMNRVKERVDYERLKEQMDLQRLKENIPDMNKLKESVNMQGLKDNMNMDALKQNASNLVNRKSTRANPDVNIIDEQNQINPNILREQNI